jgi:hypothetical protein
VSRQPVVTGVRLVPHRASTVLHWLQWPPSLHAPLATAWGSGGDKDWGEALLPPVRALCLTGGAPSQGRCGPSSVGVSLVVWILGVWWPLMRIM